MRFAIHFRGHGRGAAAERHPVDSQGRPDLSTFHRPAAEYARLHLEGLAEYDFAKRVAGSWGLIAKGSESIPFLVALLRHPDAEARADGAAGLAEIGRENPAIEGALVAALGTAETDEERDTLLQALGQLRTTSAIPAIAVLIRAEDTDEDTRGTAIEALGKIARCRFDQKPNPLGAALNYLDSVGQ